MNIKFTKYQGTGNDFVMINAMEDISFHFDDKAMIAQICDRKFGVGADGLIFLLPSKEYDFEMDYFNADGARSSMCGNGGRCIVDFAYQNGVIGKETTFIAVDGPHKAKIENDLILLQMGDVKQLDILEQAYVCNTGSPHFVQFVEELNNLDVFEQGKRIRNSEAYIDEGINVNFVSIQDDSIFVRTYERGVEDETLSCGTGVTAAAIATMCKEKTYGQSEISVETLGGSLKIKLVRSGDKIFENIWLCGPAQSVFEGILAV